jgi:aldehyde:ferredoxin oxidoreductase
MQPILKIDLSSSSTEKLDVPLDWGYAYLGGASLAARLLFDHLIPGLDPLSPEAPLLFMTGPLTGTAGTAVGRFTISALSPATRLWGESNCGGFWGPELRSAGFSGLWITGQAEKPVYITIRDQQVAILPASHLWGLDTYSTQTAVASEWGAGKPRMAVIGPAGEAQIPFALILTDHGRVAGRTGMGAVMGSKQLKAIAVEGHGQIPVHDPSSFAALRSEANRQLRADPATRVLHDLGSAAASDYFDYLGEMPKRYFQADVFDEATRISGSSVAENILSGVTTCHGCVIACGRVVSLGDGMRRKGPEYETLVGFGPNLWISDPVVVTRLGELCDRYGMDSISLSNTIGLAFTLYEKGIINDADTGELKLLWGDASVVERLVHLTANREGFGAQLAEGALAFGRIFGAEDEAVQVNGLEVAYHDPRGVSGMALVYATSPRGACHNQSDYFMVEIGQVETEIGTMAHARQGGAEKAASVAHHQDYRTLWNSLVMCIFANVPATTLLSLVNSACGFEWGISDLLKAGERAWNLKRVINNRLGLHSECDKLPKALLVPFPDSGREPAGFVPDLKAMLAAYYKARGWDPVTGFPTREKLSELGLSWVIDDLWHSPMGT